MSGAVCKTIICRLPAMRAAERASLTIGALDAVYEATVHAQQLPGTYAQWMAIAAAEEKAAAILIGADEEAAKIIKSALAAVLP